MPIYVCRHCGLVVKNNGGSCREIDMIEVGEHTYCIDCAKKIVLALLEEIWVPVAVREFGGVELLVVEPSREADTKAIACEQSPMLAVARRLKEVEEKEWHSIILQG